MNLAREINDFLYAFGWNDLKVTHYYNSVELYDAFIVFNGEHVVTTFKVDHSQIERDEATPRKIAGGIINYISIEQMKSPHIIASISNIKEV